MFAKLVVFFAPILSQNAINHLNTPVHYINLSFTNKFISLYITIQLFTFITPVIVILIFVFDVTSE